MKRTLADAARVMSATLHGEDRPFGPVSSDTRTLEAGDLFVALRGPHFDANEFVPVAAQRLAAGAVVERLHGISLPQLLVRDSLSALTALARAWREQFFAAPHRSRRQQWQDDGQGNDRIDHVAGRARASRPAAISTITLACR